MPNGFEITSMSMEVNDDFKAAFSDPRRQHFLGVIRYFTKYLVLLVRSFFPILAGLAISDGLRQYAEVIGWGIFTLVVVAAIVEYWRFRFHVENRTIIIQKGLLEQETITIPFDRIQALHLEQAPWQRFVGLTGLKIDTAGTSGSEVDLQALKIDEANVLRDGIMSAREESVTSSSENEPESKLLVHLSLNALLKVGVTQDHLRNGFLAFGAVIALYEPLKSWIDVWLSAVPEMVWSVLSWTWFLFIPLGVFLFLILSFTISIIGAVLKYFNLRAALHAQEISLKAGLLRRFEYRIPLTKIQILEWKSNLLRRSLHIETLRIFQASAQESDASGKGLAISVPGISQQASSKLVTAVFHDQTYDVKAEQIQPDSYLFYRLLITRILSGSVLSFAFASGWGQLFMIGLVLLWAFWSSRKIFENHWLRATPDLCQLHSGWLRKKRTLFSFYQLQRVVFYQNVVMRKRGVAHITFATSAGNRTFKYLNETDASRLYDWSLAQIEQSDLEWM
jgi:putative membrane protein